MSDELAQLRHNAAKLRMEALIAVQEQRNTILDILTYSETYPALKTIRLIDLLCATGVKKSRAEKMLAEVVNTVQSYGAGSRKVNVAWLLDRRAGGRRIAAFFDFASPSETSPWPGFPFTAPPRDSHSTPKTYTSKG